MAGKRNFKVVRLPEREVIRAVQNHFSDNRNVRVWRRNTGAVEKDRRFIRFGVPGMSDFFGIIRKMICPKCGRVVGRGVHLEIECKRYGGRLTQQQKDYLNMIRKMDGIALVVAPFPTESDPTGFQAVHKQLDTIDREVCYQCSER